VGGVEVDPSEVVTGDDRDTPLESIDLPLLGSSFVFLDDLPCLFCRSRRRSSAGEAASNMTLPPSPPPS